MIYNLRDKGEFTMTASIVVFGAAQSCIGEAVTRLLASSGSRVIGTYEPDDAETAARLTDELEGSVELHEVDHSSRQSLASFIEKVSDRLTGIVFAQMYFNLEDPDQFDFELWERSLSVNLTGPNFALHALKGRLDPDASVVVVTSTEAFIGSFGASAYAATKAAIHN